MKKFLIGCAIVAGVFVLLSKRSHEIPYGPFLSLGLALSLFFGDVLIRASGIEDTVRVLGEYYTWSR